MGRASSGWHVFIKINMKKEKVCCLFYTTAVYVAVYFCLFEQCLLVYLNIFG